MQSPGSRNDSAVCASIAVLTNRVLWDAIADCMTGYPRAVAKYVRDRAGAASLERIESDWAFRRQLEPSGLSRDGMLVHLAIAADDVHALAAVLALRKRLAHYRHDPKLDVRQAMRCAVLFDRIRVLQCIAERKTAEPATAWPWEPHLLTLAMHNAEHTSVQVVDWIFTHAPRACNPLPRAHMQQCARRGRLDLVQWLYEHDCKLSRKAVREAAMHGHLPVLKYLYARTRARCRAAVMNHAAASGDLDLIKCLVANDAKRRSRSAINFAAQHGHLAIVQFLLAHNTQVDVTRVLDFAARSGSLALVEYLHALFPASGCTTQAMDSAAAFGHLEVVKFLHEHRREGCSSSALELPIQHGNVAVVEFLYERYSHLRVPPTAFEAAAASGHVEVLQFLHSHALGSYSPNALNWAARRGRLAVVQFLCEQYPDLDVPSVVFDGAVANGHLDVVEFLYDRFPGSYTPNALALAASHGHLDILTFLHERYPGLECSSSVLDLAAANERLKVVQFLHDKFPSCYTPNALACAARRGRLDVVAFLCEHCSERDVTDALRAADLFGQRNVVEYLRVRLAGSAPSSEHEQH